jgi:predicted nuclease of predicted toxin-antitoxin system
MEFYLDDCADADDLMEFLRQAGHSVHSPRGEGTRGVDDPVHLAHAAARGYILITKDPDDFRQLHAEWQRQGQAHAGILLIYEENIRGKDMEAADIVRAIGKLQASGVPILNELHVLNQWR